MQWGFEVELEARNLNQNLQILLDRTGPGLERYMRDDLARYLAGRAADRFATEGDEAVGGPWAPLRPATETRRAARGFPPAHPINERTGDLRNYIIGSNGTVAGGPDDWDLTWPDGPPSQELSDKLETAQVGRNFPRTQPRPVVGLGVTDYNDILDDLSAFITRDLL
jgi:hypothetical protein